MKTKRRSNQLLILVTLVFAVCITIQDAYAQGGVWNLSTQGVSTTLPMTPAPVTEFQVYSNTSTNPIITVNWGGAPNLASSAWGALAGLQGNAPVYSTLSGTGSLVLHNEGFTQGGDLILTTYHPATAPTNGYPTYIQDDGGAIRFATHQDGVGPDLDQERMTILSNGNVGIGVSRPLSILQLPNLMTFGACSGNPMAGPSTPFIGCNWAEGWEVSGNGYLDCIFPAGRQYGFDDRYIDVNSGDSASRIQFRRGEVDLQTASGYLPDENPCGTDLTFMPVLEPLSNGIGSSITRFYSGCMQIGMPAGDANQPGASNTLEVNGGALVGSDWVGSATTNGNISPKAPQNGLLVEGAVEIGTNTSMDPTVTPHIRSTPAGGTYSLVVNGSELAQEVVVRTDFTPDFVFKPDYKLTKISDLGDAIRRLGHLPNVPSAAEIADQGVEVGSMEMKLLQKVEELTLYAIESDKKIAKLTKKVEELELMQK